MLQIEYIRVVFPPFILPKKPTKYKSLKKLMYRNPLYPGLYQTQRLVPHAIRVSIWCRAACRIRVPNLTSWGIHQVGPQAMIPLDSLTVRQYGICTRSCSTRLNFLFSTFYYGFWSGMLFYRWMHLWHYAVGCLPSSPYWKVNGSTGYVHVSGVRYHWTIQTPQDDNKYSHHFSYYFSCCQKSHTIEHSSKNSFVVCDMWWMRSIYP